MNYGRLTSTNKNCDSYYVKWKTKQNDGFSYLSFFDRTDSFETRQILNCERLKYVVVKIVSAGVFLLPVMKIFSPENRSDY